MIPIIDLIDGGRNPGGATSPNNPNDYLNPPNNNNINPTGGYNKDTFSMLLKQYLFMDNTDPMTQAIIDEFWTAYDTKFKNESIPVSDLPDLIINTQYAPKFSNYYRAYIDIRRDKNNVTGITSLAQFNQARMQYKQLLKAYGLNDLANNTNADKFLVNNISAEEAATRLQAAYNTINTADYYLKKQLGMLGIQDSELAQALLMGKEGALQLQNKIAVANINAAQEETGYASAFTPRILALSEGVTRQQARTAFAKTKAELGGYTAAASRAGISTQDLKRELEGENLLGMASQRRKRIQTAEQNLFSGTSGTFAGSLGSKMAAGQL